jgi:hypothetical protein
MMLKDVLQTMYLPENIWQRSGDANRLEFFGG